jgi:uncharacterized protein (DUF58 family)
MKRILTFALTLIVLVLGAVIVFANPLNALAIIFGMFLISVAILNLAIQIYFPPTPEQTVELKVVEEPPKLSVRVEKPKKRSKKRKKR